MMMYSDVMDASQNVYNTLTADKMADAYTHMSPLPFETHTHTHTIRAPHIATYHLARMWWRQDCMR